MSRTTPQRRVALVIGSGSIKCAASIGLWRVLQAGFFPIELPQPPGWEIRALFQSAKQVSGDFYDAFSFSRGKQVGLVVADVCDKGVGAALFMGLFRSLFRAFADQHYAMSWTDVLADRGASTGSTSSSSIRRARPTVGATALKNAVALTNNHIARPHGHANMFATTFFGVLDPANGLLPDIEFRLEQFRLEPGDVLVAFTDGVTEARGPDGELFGDDRLLAAMNRSASSAAELLSRIETDLAGHTAGAVQSDDITMLAVRRMAA